MSSKAFNPHQKNFKSRMCRHYLRGYCMLGDKCNFAHSWDEIQRFSPRNGRSRKFVFAEVSLGEELRNIGGNSPDTVMAINNVQHTTKENTIDKHEETYRLQDGKDSSKFGKKVKEPAVSWRQRFASEVRRQTHTPTEEILSAEQ